MQNPHCKRCDLTGGSPLFLNPGPRVRSAPGALSLSAPLEGEGQEGEDDDEEEPYTHSGGGPSSPNPFSRPALCGAHS